MIIFKYKIKDFFIKYLKFIILNYFVYLLIAFLTLTLPLLLSVTSYINSPAGTDTSFWIMPFVSLIPIAFSMRTLIYFFKNEIIKFIITLPMCYIITDGFLTFYKFKDIVDDYKQIFIHIKSIF